MSPTYFIQVCKAGNSGYLLFKLPLFHRQRIRISVSNQLKEYPQFRMRAQARGERQTGLSKGQMSVKHSLEGSPLFQGHPLPGHPELLPGAGELTFSSQELKGRLLSAHMDVKPIWA